MGPDGVRWVEVESERVRGEGRREGSWVVRRKGICKKNSLFHPITAIYVHTKEKSFTEIMR